MKVVLPELGEGISNVEIRDVLVKEGDTLSKDDPILILETDKASMEIPSEVDGVISEVHVKAGDTISPNDIILSINNIDGDKAIDEDEAEKIPSSKNNDIPSEETVVQNNINNLEIDENQDTLQNEIEKNNLAKILASPSTRKLARELGCDISLVNGTGDKSRVTKEDVLKYVNQHLSVKEIGFNSNDLKKILKDEISTIKNDIIDEIVTLNDDEDTHIDYTKWGLTENIPLNKVKLATGKNMTKAWSTIPQVTQFDNSDITNLYKSYKYLKNKNKDEKIKVSLIPFYIKLLVESLKKFPEINSSLSADKKSLIIKKYVNVGVAVDTMKGLVVPVIKNCEKKSIKEISVELTDLSKKAHNNNLELSDIEGGTITISSLGGIGGTYFTPIVIPSQAAILGFSKAEKKILLNNNKLENRLILPFSISYDHRIIDGALAAKFTTKLKTLLSSAKLIGKNYVKK